MCVSQPGKICNDFKNCTYYLKLKFHKIVSENFSFESKTITIFTHISIF